jgi:hypothetical protein
VNLAQGIAFVLCVGAIFIALTLVLKVRVYGGYKEVMYWHHLRVKVMYYLLIAAFVVSHMTPLK